MATATEVKVWDPLVRIFHWGLVASFTIAYLLTDEDKWLNVHVWAGYTVIGLLVVRLIWGFIGTEHARFSDFVYSPRVALNYVKEVFTLRARRYLGHNPAGGWMIVLLLVMLVLVSASGLALYGVDQHAGPLAGMLAGLGESWEDALEEAHEFFANFTVFLVVIHLGGVLVESVLHKENLARAMVTGRKRAEG